MLQSDDAPTASAHDASDAHDDVATTSLGTAVSLLPVAAAGEGTGVDGDSRWGGAWRPAAAALWRRLRRPRLLLQEVAGGGGNGSYAEPEDRNLSNSGKRRGLRRRNHKKLEDESYRRVRLRHLRAMLKGSDVTSQVVSHIKASGDGYSSPAVWSGVFTSLSPTDTGGVLASLFWLLVLAICLLCSSEVCQQGMAENFLCETGIWVAAQTLASIILSYGSFLVALAVLALHQRHVADTLKSRRLHVKLQRELLKRLREGIRKYSDEAESVDGEELYQSEQLQAAGQQSDFKSQRPTKQLASSQSNATGCHDSNPNNSVVVVESAAARRRRERQELVAMMRELEGLIVKDLQLMGLQLEDLQLLDRALGGPKRIGRAWLSANCRVSLYKAHGHTAAAYAQLQRF